MTQVTRNTVLNHSAAIQSVQYLWSQFEHETIKQQIMIRQSILLFLATLLIAGTVSAQSKYSTKSFQLTVNGTSNMHDWSSKATNVVVSGDFGLNNTTLEKINAAYKEMMIKSDPAMKEIFEKYPAYQPITRLPAPNFFAPPKNDEELTPQERLLAAGWGYVTIDPATIQPDNGAGLTRGIIGLTNMGQPRKPDQWGALRAWGWGASRALDYLETEPLVNAKQVGIEGVSRYGKGALVTMAFDERFTLSLFRRLIRSGKGQTF